MRSFTSFPFPFRSVMAPLRQPRSPDNPADVQRASPRPTFLTSTAACFIVRAPPRGPLTRDPPTPRSNCVFAFFRWATVHGTDQAGSGRGTAVEYAWLIMMTPGQLFTDSRSDIRARWPFRTLRCDAAQVCADPHVQQRARQCSRPEENWGGRRGGLCLRMKGPGPKGRARATVVHDLRLPPPVDLRRSTLGQRRRLAGAWSWREDCGCRPARAAQLEVALAHLGTERPDEVVGEQQDIVTRPPAPSQSRRGGQGDRGCTGVSSSTVIGGLKELLPAACHDSVSCLPSGATRRTALVEGPDDSRTLRPQDLQPWLATTRFPVPAGVRVGPGGVREVHLSPPTLHAVLAQAVTEGQGVRERDGTAARHCEGEFYRAGASRLFTKPDCTGTHPEEEPPDKQRDLSGAFLSRIMQLNRRYQRPRRWCAKHAKRTRLELRGPDRGAPRDAGIHRAQTPSLNPPAASPFASFGVKRLGLAQARS